MSSCHQYTEIRTSRFIIWLDFHSWSFLMFLYFTTVHTELRYSVEILRLFLSPLLGSGQILGQEAVAVLYPQLLSTQIIVCDCGQIDCQNAFWFRSNSSHSKLQYLGRVNKASRSTHAPQVDKERFKLYHPSGTSFTLHVNSVTKEDAGIYSCVITDKKHTEIWKPGILLDPGG